MSFSADNCSPQLQAFMGEAFDRPLIAAFLARAAAELPAGTRVLDAGAGSAPYKELVAHCEYTSLDLLPGEAVDIVASLEDVPLPDASFEAVLLTQVLHHLPRPRSALAELHRVVTPAGHLIVTAPLVWPLHEEPHDYRRYTSHGLRAALEEAGFSVVRLEPLGGYFTTLTQVLRSGLGSVRRVTPTDEATRGSRSLRRAAALAFQRMGGAARQLDRLDVRRVLPLGFGCVAVRRA